MALIPTHHPVVALVYSLQPSRDTMSLEATRPPHGHKSFLYAFYMLTCVLMPRHVAAGRSPAGSGLATSMRQATIHTDFLVSSSASSSRQLAEVETETEWTFDASGQWAGLEVCPELAAILTRTPSESSRLGNFTEIPEKSIISDCSSSSSLYILDGETLVEALQEPAPLLKMIILEPSDVTVWPEGTGTPFFASGSVNMIDCQGGVLDLRHRNFELGVELVTVSFYRCTVIFPDTNGLWFALSYYYDSHSIFPCNGTSAIAQAADYSRSNPGVFDELTSNLGPVSTTHVRNHTTWCFTEQDLLDLYGSSAADETEEEDPSSASWIPWVISAGVVLAVVAAGMGVWMCFGFPGCCCRRMQDHQPKHFNTRDKHQGQDDPYAQHRSTAELAAALTTVLSSQRYGSDGHDNSRACTNSSHVSQSNDRGHLVHDCPDCGHSQGRHPPSLRVLSDSRSTNPADGRHCHHCDGHPGSGGGGSDRDQYYHMDPPPRGPRSMHGPLPTAPRTKVITDAWVEDSLEARARIGGGVRMGPGRERLSEVDTMSIDERGSNRSISFAPPRRTNGGSGRVNVLKSFSRGNLQQHNAGAEFASSNPPTARSERSEYYDARDNQDSDSQAHSTSVNGSPRVPPASPRGAETNGQDFFDSRRSQNALLSPRGSPRHPGLQEYTTLPSTHPILSPGNSPRRMVARGGV